jgi:hypothetical protein
VYFRVGQAPEIEFQEFTGWKTNKIKILGFDQESK